MDSPSNTPLFKTESLTFAAFLRSKDALRFLGCERGDLDRVKFVFADPEGLGERLMSDYINGNDTTHARVFHESVRRLRIAMKHAKGGYNAQ